MFGIIGLCALDCSYSGPYTVKSSSNTWDGYCNLKRASYLSRPRLKFLFKKINKYLRKTLKTQNSLIKARPTTLTQWTIKPTCFAQADTKISSSILRNYYLHQKEC